MYIVVMANRIWISTGLILGIVCQAYCSVNCAVTGPGRFAEPTDTTCKGYIFCVYDTSTSSYLALNYTCPSTSVFNPNTATCTTNYVCNVTSPNTVPSVCTANGYIADPTSNDCSTYIECVEVNSVFIETYFTCPSNTYFDPETTICQYDYICPTSTFTCTAPGRFANIADNTCKMYYMCVPNSAGTFLQYEYTCPSTSVFSPVDRMCTTSYTCGQVIPVSPAFLRHGRPYYHKSQNKHLLFFSIDFSQMTNFW